MQERNAKKEEKFVPPLAARKTVFAVPKSLAKREETDLLPHFPAFALFLFTFTACIYGIIPHFIEIAFRNRLPAGFSASIFPHFARIRQPFGSVRRSRPRACARLPDRPPPPPAPFSALFAIILAFVTASFPTLYDFAVFLCSHADLFSPPCARFRTRALRPGGTQNLFLEKHFTFEKRCAILFRHQKKPSTRSPAG